MQELQIHSKNTDSYFPIETILLKKKKIKQQRTFSKKIDSAWLYFTSQTACRMDIGPTVTVIGSWATSAEESHYREFQEQ